MTPLTGPLTDWPTDSTNYKEMLSHLKTPESRDSDDDDFSCGDK